MAGLQPRAANTFVGELGGDLLHGLSGTGDHGVGSVVRRDRHGREFADDLVDVFGIGEHRNHSTAFGQAAEQSAAFGYQPCAVFQAEHSGHTGRCVLAHAMPQHHIRLNAPGLPQPRQAHLDSEQRWLRKRRVLQGLASLAAALTVVGEEHVQQRLRQNAIDRGRAAFHSVGEDRFTVEQLASHTGVLAPLAGEQPRRRGVVGMFAAHDTGPKLILGQTGQTIAHMLDRVRDQSCTVFEMRTARSSGEAYLGEVGIRMGPQPGVVALRQRGQRLWCPGRQGKHIKGLLVAVVPRGP